MLEYYFPPTTDSDAPATHRLTPPPSPSSSSSSPPSHPPTRPLPTPPTARDRKSRLLARLSHLPHPHGHRHTPRPAPPRSLSMPPAPPGSARHGRQRSSSTTDALQLPPPPPLPQVQVQANLPPSPAREIGNPFSYLRSRRQPQQPTSPNPNPNPTPGSNNPTPPNISSTTSNTSNVSNTSAAASQPPQSPPHSPIPGAGPHVHLPHLSLHRRHSTTARDAPVLVPPIAVPAVVGAVVPAIHPAPTGHTADGRPTHRLRLVPHLETARSLIFDPILRTLPEGGEPLRVGRFTERRAAQEGAGGSDEGKIAFRSKVVSRAHAEVWCDLSGKVLIKDTASSSGTFLNHIRLSSPNVESRPFPLRDGDVIQLGVDYQGGNEEIYRCVKIRVELDRAVGGREAFNTHALAQIEALAGAAPPVAADAVAVVPGDGQATAAKKASITECSICISSVTVCQALFIAPCSHVFHYKCIRPLVEKRYPGFMCPLCRCYADLEADVDDDGEEVIVKPIPPQAALAPVAPPPPAPVPVPQPVQIVQPQDDQDMDEVVAGPPAREEDELEVEDGLENVSDDDDEQAVHEQATMDEDDEDDQEEEEEEEEEEFIHISSPPPTSTNGISIAGPSRSHPQPVQPPEGPFDNATPMNHLFLSTLADMPARRSQLLGSTGAGGLSPIPSVASMAEAASANGNGSGNGRARKGKGKNRAPVVVLPPTTAGATDTQGSAGPKDHVADEEDEDEDEDDGGETTDGVAVVPRARARPVRADRDGDSLMEGERGPLRPPSKKRKLRA